MFMSMQLLLFIFIVFSMDFTILCFLRNRLHFTIFRTPKSISYFFQTTTALSISSIDISLISNLVTSQQPVLSKKKLSSSSSSVKKFDRTNRVDGQKKWTHELNLLIGDRNDDPNESSNTSRLNLIIELAKELLYSGIPEQVLELYAAYCAIIRNKHLSNANIPNNNTSVQVLPDKKLLVVVVRAFIALSDIKGALKLLQASSRLGLNFDNESKSLLMADLAISSCEGLHAALQLRQQMLDRGEVIGMKGSSGLLRALHTFGLPYNDIKLPQLSTSNKNQMLNKRFVSASSLLVDGAANEEEVLLNEKESNMFSMSATRIETLALEIAEMNLKHVKHKSKFITEELKTYDKPEKSRNHLITTELLRIIFRTSIVISYSQNSQKVNADKISNRHRYSIIDFQLDKNIEKEEQTAIGLAGALHIMDVFNIKWDLQVADVLLDECLRVGDINGMTFVTQQMQERNIAARTSTCNSLLRRYVDNGDAESAYALVHDIMMMNSKEKDAALTAPNTETWVLLLQACLPTRKGRFYAKIVIEKLLNKGDNDDVTDKPVSINIDLWNLILQHSIMSRSDKEAVNTMETFNSSNGHNNQLFRTLEDMVISDVQPQESTMIALYNSFLSMNDIVSAMKLYKMQIQGEVIRSQYLKTTPIHSFAYFNAPNVNISTSERDISILYQKYISLLSSSNAADDNSKDNDVKHKSDRRKIQNELLISMCLPPLSLKTAHCLLELLSTRGDYANAKLIFRDICEREKPTIPSTPETMVSNFSKVKANNISAIYPTENLLPKSQLYPDRTTFALMIETILKASELQREGEVNKENQTSKLPKMQKSYLSIILNIIKVMEDQYKLTPDRRIYASLILAFGRHGDIPSALGVFQEMRSFYFPDVGTLQSILDVCIGSPSDLRQVSMVLEEMLNQNNIELEVYSKDILMQGFKDAKSLGAALVNMEQQQLLNNKQYHQCVEVSLSVLSVLVQAIRSSTLQRKRSINLQSELEDCLVYLGSAGIRLESETMEYFRMPPEPALNSPNSRHYNRQFIPQKRKQRSLLDIEMPDDFRSDLDIPLRGYNMNKQTIQNKLPYFESNPKRNEWLSHSNAMVALLNGELLQGMNNLDDLNEQLLSEIDQEDSNEAESSSNSDDDDDTKATDKDKISQTSKVPQSKKDNSLLDDTNSYLEAVELNNLFKQQMRPTPKSVDVWIPTTQTKSKTKLSPKHNIILNRPQNNLNSKTIQTKELNKLINASNNNIILKDLYKIKNRIEKRNMNSPTKSSINYINIIKPSP